MLKNGFTHGSATKILDKAKRDEDWEYERAKSIWEEEPVSSNFLACLKDSTFKPSDPFVSEEEYAREWEERSSAWCSAYSYLLSRPETMTVKRTPALEAALRVLDAKCRDALRIADGGRWSSLGSYWKRIIGIYYGEMTQKFGSLAIVEPSYVSVWMVSVFKSSRMRWEQ